MKAEKGCEDANNDVEKDKIIKPLTNTEKYRNEIEKYFKVDNIIIRNNTNKKKIPFDKLYHNNIYRCKIGFVDYNFYYYDGILMCYLDLLDTWDYEHYCNIHVIITNNKEELKQHTTLLYPEISLNLNKLL